MSTNKYNCADTHHSIANSARIIGLATLLSRILGFIRDMVIARLFGVYLYAQAFVIAFKLPNLFRDLAGEGAANAAFIPVFSEYLAKKNKQEFWHLINIILNATMVALSVITILGIVFAPVIIRAIAPGFVADSQKFLATVELTRSIFPYILLIGLAAYATAVLNSLRHFSVPAFAPCLLNISIIICALVWGEGIAGLATGVLIGGMLQLAVQVPILYHQGFRFSFVFDLEHAAVKQIARLMGPRLFSSAVYQLNNFVDSIFASLSIIVGEGAVAALYFAYRLIQFPLGIFSTALSQAILPALSSQALEPDKDKLKQTLLFGLRAVLFVMIPASVGLMVLAKPIVSALFRGGRFDMYAVNTTANALLFYSLGLFAYGVTRILQNCFFALKDTATPAKFAVATLGMNILLNSLLIFPLKLSGLALATSISGVITCTMLFVALYHKLGGFQIKSLIRYALKVIAASIGMGLVCYLAAQKHFVLQSHIASRIANLLFPIICGMAAYLVLCLVLKIEKSSALRKII